MPKIEFRDVKLAFGDKVVLDGVTFGVEPGEMKVILGQSFSTVPMNSCGRRKTHSCGTSFMAMKTRPDNLALPVFNSKLYPRAQL